MRSRALWALVAAANVAIYLLMVASTGRTEFTSRQALAWGADFGPLTVGEGEWWRLLTATYLHGSFSHLLGNMICLWAWGRFVEMRLGAPRFLLAYTACGLVASFASVSFNPDVVSLGASGAILGMLGVMGGLRLKGDASVPANVVFINAIYSIPLAVLSPQVDWVAHAAGFAAGILAGMVLGRATPTYAPPPEEEEPTAPSGPWG
ncbi:MAG: rhomboid family intramembrane serine protease [Bauldia sp.]